MSRYWRRASASKAGALIDGRSYFGALYHAARRARRSIVMCGWQFDSSVRLLRGEDAEDAPLPCELLPFLDALCLENPELEVHILAWDFSLVYVPERELLQRWVFERCKSGRVHFHFDDKVPPGGSHHQKLVVIDGNLAFFGGMDVCSSRWDDSAHLTSMPERRNTRGFSYAPFHDVQAFVVGDAARELQTLFEDRFERATGRELALPVCVDDARWDFVEGDVSLPASDVLLSRTMYHPNIHEISDLLLTNIENARELVYLESQYLTSVAVRDALIRRFGRGDLDVVVILPESPNAKEDLALGDAQAQIIQSIADSGGSFRAYYPGRGPGPSTYVHAKVMIVDDRILTVGSANLTNRSLSLDTELCVTWELDRADEQIRALRTRLLSEHTGVSAAGLAATRGLVQELDALASADSHLGAHDHLRRDPRPAAVRAAVFDPVKPLDELAVDDLISRTWSEWFTRSVETVEGWFQ
ncbi:MAG: phospholipase [Myxococcales bacterium]|nr:phospholipase [Myxococcales bacterium]